MFCGLQRLRKVSKQYGDENRLCLHPFNQFYNLLDYAHTMGSEKIAKFDTGLYGDSM